MREVLCKCLKDVLVKRKLTFAECAKLARSSKTQINNIVNHNGREVSLEKMIAIIKTLGYSIEINLKEVIE